MPPAENTPDFDKMSPEEIMAWMESLAKRQGAKMEEFTTSADLDIPEIDPDTVVIDEPGYVPYGEERPPKPEKPQPIAPPVPLPPARQPAASMPPAPPARQPAAPPPPTPPRQPELPHLEPKPDEGVADPQIAASAAAAPDPMAWLESLAADQTSGDIFNLDLSALTAEPQPTPAPAVDPMAWLKNLTETQGEADKSEPITPSAPPPAAEEVGDPFASGVDPMAWLESLAKRQGAREEELTTSADLNVPMPTDAVIDEPGYKPFSFDAPPTEPRRPPAPKPAAPPPTPEPIESVEEEEAEPALANPEAWLSSLAATQGFGEEPETMVEPPAEPEAETMSISDIEAAIASGTVTSEQMQYYLEHQTEVFAQELVEEGVEEYDPNAPPVPADLPDWLLESVGAPPAPEEPKTSPPALIEEILEPPAVVDMPDWLKEDVSQGDLDFESIFAEAGEEAPAPAAEPTDFEMPLTYEIEVDPGDPWVEAFDLEHEQGMADINTVPEWYARNLSDPERIAIVDRQAGEAAAESAALIDAALPPETELRPGELEALPEWLQDAAPAPVAVTPPTSEEPAYAGDIPDWLREVEASVSPDEIPDWLVETLEPAEDLSTIFPLAEEPAPVVEPPPPAAPPRPVAPPKPAPPRPAAVSASIAEARSYSQSGDLASSLLAYEALIRASSELEDVVDDLTGLVKVHKDNPAVFRVLGDGLMRQGKLQAALDIYREALNQL